jgi:tetratricopeptide (TPR) repeat protein
MLARNAWILLPVVMTAAGSVPSQAQQVDGTELERRGLYEQAVVAYRQVLQTDRTNVTAWLGLERVLGQMSLLESIFSLVDSVLAELPENRFVREIQLRAWSSLGRLDSLESAANRWIAAAPESTDPYRQWSFALARRGEYDRAIEILQAGRNQLGQTALASELARMYGSSGDWQAASGEWSTAVAENESHVMSAVAALRDAPAWARESALRPLTPPEGDSAAGRLGAELLVTWGRAEEGWSLLDSSLPSDRGRAAAALNRFIERTRRVGGEQSARARGYALERLAGITSGQESERARLEAAQAFADAGELAGARRMLERLAESPATTPSDAGEAMATVIRVTIELGRTDEAQQRFLEWQDRMSADATEQLRHRLAGAWIEQGELQRAETILEGDPTIGSLALLGWVRLYGGDLMGASELFRAAGPFALSREEATRRTGMMALIQRIEADSVPGLGPALLYLAQGDTARSVEGIGEAARTVPRLGGRAELLTLAGELAVASRDYSTAEPLLLDAIDADPGGPAAPAAEYALALLMSRTERPDLAKQRLEHLILTYTDSAVVPDARRMLDQLSGAIPRS